MNSLKSSSKGRFNALVLSCLILALSLGSVLNSNNKEKISEVLKRCTSEDVKMVDKTTAFYCFLDFFIEEPLKEVLKIKKGIEDQTVDFNEKIETYGQILILEDWMRSLKVEKFTKGLLREKMDFEIIKKFTIDNLNENMKRLKKLREDFYTSRAEKKLIKNSEKEKLDKSDL